MTSGSVSDARFMQLAENGMVRPCPPGTFFNGTGAASASDCEPCPIGHYCSLVDGINPGPTKCPGLGVRSTTLTTGGSDITACVCLSGFHLKDKVCQACPLGFATVWPRIDGPATECVADPAFNCSGVSSSAGSSAVRAWASSVILDPGLLPGLVGLVVDPDRGLLAQDRVRGQAWDIARAEWVPSWTDSPYAAERWFDIEDGLRVKGRAAHSGVVVFEPPAAAGVSAMALHPDARHLIVASRAGAVIYYVDLETLQSGTLQQLGDNLLVETLAVSDSGGDLVVGGARAAAAPRPVQAANHQAVLLLISAANPALYLSEWRGATPVAMALRAPLWEQEALGSELARVLAARFRPGLPRRVVAVAQRRRVGAPPGVLGLPHVVELTESCVECPAGAKRSHSADAVTGAAPPCSCPAGTTPSTDATLFTGTDRPLMLGNGESALVGEEEALAARALLQCLPCAPGNYCPDGKKSEPCPEAASGQVTSLPGTDRPEHCFCVAGRFGFPACSPCLPGHFCPALGPGFEAMIACGERSSSPGGTQASSAAACVCTDGYYNPLSEASGSHECVLCEPNFYCKDGSRSPCPDAAKHTIDGGAGATSVSQCICGDGHVNDPITGDCVPCPDGFYCFVSGSGSKAVLRCPDGQHTLGAGASSVRDCLCPVGFTQASYAPYGCIVCPVSFFCNGIDADPQECHSGLTTLPPNVTQVQAAVDPVSGLLDTTKLPPGAGKVDDCSCGPGKHRIAIGITLDNKPQFLCESCIRNHYCPDGMQLLPCPSSRVTPEGVVATSVDECVCLPPFAPYADDPARTECACSAGYVAVGGGNCERCPAGLTSISGVATDAELHCICPKGLFPSDSSFPGLSSQCAVCPVGHYCELGVSLPTPCPSGTYQPALGATDVTWCLPCTNGGGSENPGAESVQDCSHAFLKLTIPNGFDTATIDLRPVMRVDFVLANIRQVSPAVRSLLSRTFSQLIADWDRNFATLIQTTVGTTVSSTRAAQIYNERFPCAVFSSFVSPTSPAPLGILTAPDLGDGTIEFTGPDSNFEIVVTMEITIPLGAMTALGSLQSVRGVMKGARAISREPALALAALWSLTEFIESAADDGRITARLNAELDAQYRREASFAAALAAKASDSSQSFAEQLASMGAGVSVHASGAGPNLVRATLPFRMPNAGVQTLASNIILKSELSAEFPTGFDPDEFSSRFRYSVGTQRGGYPNRNPCRFSCFLLISPAHILLQNRCITQYSDAALWERSVQRVYLFFDDRRG